MQTAEIAQLLGGVQTSVVWRYATRLGLEPAADRAYLDQYWTPGDALAMLVVQALDGKARFAEGARKCGEALDCGYPPAYLITRGGSEHVVVIETEDREQTDETVLALVLQAADTGCAVRVVKLRPMVKRLQPFLAELVDA